MTSPYAGMVAFVSLQLAVVWALGCIILYIGTYLMGSKKGGRAAAKYTALITWVFVVGFALIVGYGFFSGEIALFIERYRYAVLIEMVLLTLGCVWIMWFMATQYSRGRIAIDERFGSKENYLRAKEAAKRAGRGEAPLPTSAPAPDMGAGMVPGTLPGAADGSLGLVPDLGIATAVGTSALGAGALGGAMAAHAGQPDATATNMMSQVDPITGMPAAPGGAAAMPGQQPQFDPYGQAVGQAAAQQAPHAAPAIDPYTGMPAAPATPALDPYAGQAMPQPGMPQQAPPAPQSADMVPPMPLGASAPPMTVESNEQWLQQLGPAAVESKGTNMPGAPAVDPYTGQPLPGMPGQPPQFDAYGQPVPHAAPAIDPYTGMPAAPQAPQGFGQPAPQAPQPGMPPAPQAPGAFDPYGQAMGGQATGQMGVAPGAPPAPQQNFAQVPDFISQAMNPQAAPQPAPQPGIAPPPGQASPVPPQPGQAPPPAPGNPYGY